MPEDILSQEAGIFAQLLQNNSSRVCEAPPSSWKMPPELELQSRWFCGEFGTQFISLKKENVSIISFGYWNHADGPDFLDAHIEVDGKPLHGDIELDTKSSDWKTHRHNQSENFNHVILHLSFDDSAPIDLKTKQGASIIQIKINLLQQSLHTDFYSSSLTPPAHPGNCAPALTALDNQALTALLRSAAAFRIQRKIKRLDKIISLQGEQQALYQGLAEALGYHPNQLPMRILSQKCSLKKIPRSQKKIDALLLGSAGFLEAQTPPYDEASEETKTYLKQLWEIWWKKRTGTSTLPWKTSGARPGNHPQRRIAALATTLSQWKNFWEAYQSQSLTNIEALFAQLHHPFWSHHFTLRAPMPFFGENNKRKKLALIGKERVREFAINILYPLWLRKNPALWKEYYQLRSIAQPNFKLKRAAARFFPQHPEIKKLLRYAYTQQALLQLLQSFCTPQQNLCEGCSFPDKLNKNWQ